MAFTGNRNSPQPSAILEKSRALFFSIPQKTFYKDVNYHRFSESKNQAACTYFDSKMAPYIELSGPKFVS